MRNPYFQSIEGHFCWRDGSGAVFEVTFEDQLDEERANSRLLCAIQPDLGFMKVMLTRAETKRAELEQLQQASVKGLIVGSDDKLAATIRTSVDSSRWRVTTHHALPISIPEQVLVWASNEVSEHIFDSFVTGVARTLNPAAYEHSVWVFFPKDPELVRLAVRWCRDTK